MENKTKQSEEFYDESIVKFFNDYKLLNNRVDSIIQFSKGRISSEAQSILDLGCGMGWSSYEFAKAYPQATIVGVDLSNNLIEKGKTLFKRSNLRLEKKDITEDVISGVSNFDVMTMFDVYEHIPVELRRRLHDSMNDLLSDKGMLIISCPSAQHQKYLYEHKPSGLQPVDEIVSVEDLLVLANDINAELIYYATQGISKTNDYFYAVFQRNPKYAQLPKPSFTLQYLQRRVRRFFLKAFRKFWLADKM